MSYLYEADGSPLGMQYLDLTDEEAIWEIYWFEKNLFGDIVAIYSETGTRLATYRYGDAWGYSYISYENGGANTHAGLNPFRYRGYYYDSDLGLYRTQTRYYSPTWGRFISPDTTDVLTATPMALTDKNLYAYCDNNPIMRVDYDGEFWLVNVGVGLVTQYIGDVIGNLLDGKTGIGVLIPTSSLGEYIAAGVTALIPGTGLGGALVRNIVAECITVTEDVFLGNEVNVTNSLINIGLGTVLDASFEKISNKMSGFMNSKAPRNYSSFAHTVRQSNPNITREQIYRSMQRSIRFNRVASDAITFGLGIVRTSLPY